jgi:hypothetical protein
MNARIITAIWDAAAGMYFALWLLIARRLYARWRESEHKNLPCPRHGMPPRMSYYKCCYDKPAVESSAAAALAMAAALLWPMVLLTALVRFRPPPTAAERAATEARLTARVAELEAELGMKP